MDARKPEHLRSSWDNLPHRQHYRERIPAVLWRYYSEYTLLSHTDPRCRTQVTQYTMCAVGISTVEPLGKRISHQTKPQKGIRHVGLHSEPAGTACVSDGIYITTTTDDTPTVSGQVISAVIGDIRIQCIDGCRPFPYGPSHIREPPRASPCRV